MSVDLVSYNATKIDDITIFVDGLGRNDCFRLLKQDYIKSKTRFTEKYEGIPCNGNFCWVTVDGERVTFQLAFPEQEHNDPLKVIFPVIDYILDAAPSIEFEVLSSYDKWRNSV